MKEVAAELHMKEEEEEENGRRMVGIQELVDSGLHSVPPIYIRPPHERPGASALSSEHVRLPVIDLANLDNDDDAVIQELGQACEEWGFFQVVNHGVEPAVIERLRAAALAFFKQPVEERMRFHSPRTRGLPWSVTYSTSFNPSVEKVREWRDVLGFSRYPGLCDGFQDAPDICKKEAQEYIRGVEALAGKLYRGIFESIGLEKEYIEKEVPGILGVWMGINYYPPCPDPSLTLGLGSHTDAVCLTVLHADELPGLQIKYKGSWVPVFPVEPSAFVINLADQTQILTNGKYKSIEHRVVTNGEKPRMSIACFFGPTEDTHVAPLSKLLNEREPPRYKSTKFGDYYRNCMSNRLLANRGNLDFARI